MAVTREAVSPEDVERAARALEGRVRRTPVLPAGELSRRVGGRVSVKAENLQLTGSFKARGAFNALLRMPEGGSRARLVAASAGNHAQAVAFAARSAGATAKLVMPAAAPVAKVAAVRQYGGEVLLVDGAIDEAVEVARGLAAEEGRVLVHAFDDPVVVAGQGTVGLELAAQAPDARLVVVPLGGGGLISGIAIAARPLLDGLCVVGVQSDACAPYPPSLEAREPVPARGVNTICDGIAVKRPGEVTLPLVDRHVDQVVTVSDDEVAEAMVLLLERSKLVVEGAGAVGVAALLAGKVELPRDGDVCVVLSGGNVDASLLAECIRMGETSAGRRMVLATTVPDRPGALARLLALVAEHDGNVVEVEHLRDGIDLHVRETAIQLVMQTRGPDHSAELARVVEEEGFPVRMEREG